MSVYSELLIMGISVTFLYACAGNASNVIGGTWWVQYRWTKAKKIEEFKTEHKAYLEYNALVRRCVWETTLIIGILWGGIIVAYWFSITEFQNQILLRMQSSGIYLIVLFLLVGFIFRIIVRSFHNEQLIGNNNLGKLVALDLLIIGYSCLFVEWRLSLFIVSVLAGKYIWFDYDKDIDDWKKKIHDLIKGEQKKQVLRELSIAMEEKPVHILPGDYFLIIAFRATIIIQIVVTIWLFGFSLLLRICMH